MSRVIDQTAPVARGSNFVKSLHNKMLIIPTYLVLNSHLFELNLGYIGFREYDIFMNFFLIISYQRYVLGAIKKQLIVMFLNLCFDTKY